jgi:hypothetical protein
MSLSNRNQKPFDAQICRQIARSVVDMGKEYVQAGARRKNQADREGEHVR